MVQFSHSYMTTGKTIALIIWIFVSKVMALLFNILSRLVITFLSRRKCLLISWLSLCFVFHRWEFRISQASYLDLSQSKRPAADHKGKLVPQTTTQLRICALTR